MKKALLIMLICLSFAACKKNDDGGSTTPCEINSTAVSLMERQTEQLSVKNLSVYGATPEVVWTSSNEAVAKVSKEGLVTAVSPGEAKIHASIARELGTISEACVVTVGNVAATALKVTIPADSLEITVGDTVKTSTFAFTPLETSGQKIDIVRSDSIGEPIIKLEITKNSAAPSTIGKFNFIGLRAGTVNVEFKAADQEGISAQFIIEVKSIPVKSISFAGGDLVEVSSNGASTTIHAQLLPTDATDKLKWKTTSKFLKISSSAGDSVTVTGLCNEYQSGYAELIVTSESGIIAKTMVSVLSRSETFPQSISSLQDTVLLPLGNEWMYVPITLNPINATLPYDHSFSKIDGAYKLPKDGVLANISLTNHITSDPDGKYAFGISAPFGVVAQNSTNAVKLQTAAKLTANAVAPEDTITSKKSVVIVVGSDIPESEVVLKAAYKFVDAKIVTTAFVTPINSYVGGYSNVKAELFVPKGTAVVGQYNMTSIGVVAADLDKDNKLIKDKSIQTIDMTLHESGKYYLADFKAFTKTIAPTSYNVRYVFDYDQVKGYKAVRTVGTDMAPYAPHR